MEKTETGSYQILYKLLTAKFQLAGEDLSKELETIKKEALPKVTRQEF